MKIPTLINSSSKINGELIFTTDVRIDGEVFGKVESDKNVIIGAEGFVKGFLRAKDLVVFGRIEGNIVVSGITVLHEHASVFGNLYTKVFEVKDGATITAKVVTYEKLEAIDEAQIFLAEEMIKVEPGRRQIHNFSPVNISFEEPLDFEIEDHKDSIVVNNQLLIEELPAFSGDILSQIMEHDNIVKIETIHLEKEKTIMPMETAELISHLDSAPEISDVDSLLETNEVNTMVQFVEANGNEQFKIGEMVPTDETSISSVTVVLSANPEEISMLDFGEMEDDTFILLDPVADFSEIQQQDVSVGILEVVNSVPDSEQNHLLEFEFEDAFTENGDLVLFPLPNPVSIAGFLGEPIKEDSQRLRKVKKKVYSSDPTLTPQAVRKSKGYNLSGFEELRNLLIPVRFQEIKSAEKKNDQEKYNAKKITESDAAKKPLEVENSDFFLNDAIRQLPSDDYSSLFN